MTRVLIVDDSQGMRDLLVAILSTEPGLSIAGVAADGEEAVRKTLALRPDVISMDLRMPRLDGLGAIRAIMNEAPTPIVVLHAKHGSAADDLGFDALRAGALEVVEKPVLTSAEHVRVFRNSFGTLLKLMAEVKVVRVFAPSRGVSPPHITRMTRTPISIVGICSSTGGPSALERVFRRLPSTLPVPIVVVQHMAEGFLESFVEWLDTNCPLQVTIAENGDVPRAGHVYFAPDFLHLALDDSGLLRTVSSPAVRGHVPSGDVLLESLADVRAERAMGIVLTGMGDDGARGAARIARIGGVVLAQDEDSSIVYGMPHAVVELGVACEVLPIDRMAARIQDWTVDSGVSPIH